MSSIRGSEVKKICLACEAGAGSSLMVKNGLIKKAKKAGLDVEIVHAPATQIPDDADIIVCHTGLAGAARNAAAWHATAWHATAWHAATWHAAARHAAAGGVRSACHGAGAAHADGGLPAAGWRRAHGHPTRLSGGGVRHGRRSTVGPIKGGRSRRRWRIEWAGLLAGRVSGSVGVRAARNDALMLAP